MQTTYRLKAKEISSAFIKSVKTLFAGQEVEIVVKSVGPEINRKTELLEMIKRNRQNAPVIASDIDIRGLIDESQYPA
jgi:DNA-binding protein